MKSLDTNILLYALNADCVEHGRARQVVGGALSESDQWIVADQVYFELYRLLRSPAVLAHPLSAPEAAQTIDWYRNRSGWLTCAYEPGLMKRVAGTWDSDAFRAKATFDLVLAVTLAANGVVEFHTRNTADFAGFGLFRVHNPIDTKPGTAGTGTP